MKKHAIIPVFISHRGCPNNCVFCNQKKITARQGDVTIQDVEDTINTYMSTLKNMNLECIELSFYGGSFTGLPMDEQNAFLNIADDYKERGIISKIHMSTRPDYIDERILDNLKAKSVDVIELGVQSFDDEVLRKSKRGHTSDDVYRACSLIKDYGFTLGIQLMAGLPGDSRKSCIYSAEETAAIKPELARIYPTLVIDDTELYDMYIRGEYTPLSLEEAVSISKDMYVILDDAGINIMRVGLKATDVINKSGAVTGDTFHPAFRQLVEGLIARERIEAQLDSSDTSVTVLCRPQDVSSASGHRGCNRAYFAEKYPGLKMSFKSDDSIEKNTYRVLR